MNSFDDSLLSICRMRMAVQRHLLMGVHGSELWQKVSDAAVRLGGIDLAWVGLKKRRRLLPVAATASHLLEPGLPNYWPTPEMGMSVLVRSVLEYGQASVCCDYSTFPPSMAAAGLSAAYAMPLRKQGRVCGVIELYTQHAGFFNHDNIKLVEEIGLDLEMALDRQVEDFKRQRHMEKLQTMAYQDALTGVSNRRFFDDMFPRALAKARRTKRRVGLLLLDLDGFKEVNDRMGHHGGDEVLCKIARLFERRLRGSDLLVRMGGDEFAIVLDDLMAPDSAAQVAIDLIEALKGAEPSAPTGKLAVGVSVGIALYPDHAHDPAVLLKKADQALYRAKARGGNRCCYCAPGSGEGFVAV